MAEGYLRLYAGDKAKIYSAGVETHGLNLKAVTIMAKDGVDISTHTSNHVDEYKDVPFDYIITVCDHAKEVCPVLPNNARHFHFNFPDPAKAIGTDEEVMNQFEIVRNMIKAYAARFIERELI